MGVDCDDVMTTELVGHGVGRGRLPSADDEQGRDGPVRYHQGRLVPHPVSGELLALPRRPDAQIRSNLVSMHAGCRAALSRVRRTFSGLSTTCRCARINER